MVSKYSNLGKKNGNYKDGNRMKGNFPCPECGKDRTCEKRNAFRVCRNCKQIGVKNQRWLGGGRNYYQAIARNVIEKSIGRKLESGECIHHLDHNYKNNNITNLYLFENRSKHTKYHRMKIRFVSELFASIGKPLRLKFHNQYQMGETCVRI